MSPLIRKELRQRKYSLIAYCLSAFAFVWMYISLYPYLQSQSANYAKILETFPKGFSQAFGIDAGFLSNVQGYLAGEMYSLMWPLLAILLVVSAAGSTLAGEIEKGTMGTLLSQPISRGRLMLAKYLAGATSLVIFIVASILVCVPLAILYGIDVLPAHFLTFSIVGLLFGLAVYSFTVMLSAASNEKSHVYGIVSGILFVMYVLNIVSGLKPNLKGLRYGSAFHYFNPNEALVHGHIGWQPLVVFGVTIVVCSTIGYITFNKRDIYL